jgi:hypothetical protein
MVCAPESPRKSRAGVILKPYKPMQTPSKMALNRARASCFETRAIPMKKAKAIPVMPVARPSMLSIRLTELEIPTSQIKVRIQLRKVTRFALRKDSVNCQGIYGYIEAINRMKPGSTDQF